MEDLTVLDYHAEPKESKMICILIVFPLTMRKSVIISQGMSELQLGLLQPGLQPEIGKLIA
jgi:hypothetical protein